MDIPFFFAHISASLSSDSSDELCEDGRAMHMTQTSTMWSGVEWKFGLI